MRAFSGEGQQDREMSAKGWARLGQEILNLLDVSGARRAVRRELLSLDRRELDDCGLTPADVAPRLPDLYAQDFRVAHIAELRAA